MVRKASSAGMMLNSDSGGSINDENDWIIIDETIIDAGECTLAQPSRSDELATRPTGCVGRRLKNMPLTLGDLHIRRVEERLRREIARLERSPEQECLIRHSWERFSLCLAGRLVSVTRSRVLKARRAWFLLASRYHRRLREFTCYKATASVILLCDDTALFCKRGDVSDWPYRRARNRCLVCVANYISADDPADRNKLRSRACHIWQDVPSQKFSIFAHVLEKHGDLGRARLCIGCKKLCASEHGVFMHLGFCKALHRTLETMEDADVSFVCLIKGVLSFILGTLLGAILLF